jgi:hypothetical protein
MIKRVILLRKVINKGNGMFSPAKKVKILDGMVKNLNVTQNSHIGMWIIARILHIK